MSGICDTCRRKPCPAEGEGFRRCDFYEGGETRWERLFGAPERAARIVVALNNCRVVSCEECAARGACRYDGCGDDYDTLLEWLRGDAE